MKNQGMKITFAACWFAWTIGFLFTENNFCAYMGLSNLLIGTMLDD